MFQKGQVVRVLPHTQYNYLTQGAVTSTPREWKHKGYKSVKIVSISTDGSVEVAVNKFGDVDVVDISHLEALA